MSARRIVSVAALLIVAFARPVKGADEAVIEPVKAALVAAVTQHDGPSLAKSLDAANALVGPTATFPDVGALADWLATLPDAVTSHSTVRARRAWMYVVARRGADAVELLQPLLAEQPKNALLHAYLGEARRQTGDVAGAIDSLADAFRAGSSDEAVIPSVEKLLFDLRASPPKDERTDAPPTYTTAAAKLFALKPMVEVRLSLVRWLVVDVERAKSDPAHAATLSVALAHQLVVGSKLALPEGEATRLSKTAYAAALRMKSLPKDRLHDGDATRFDVLAVAVRLGERPGGDGHELPEALADLAEEALAKGRFVLADHLARRRLAISDSPTARRVLRSLPPDVGD